MSLLMDALKEVENRKQKGEDTQTADIEIDDIQTDEEPAILPVIINSHNAQADTQIHLDTDNKELTPDWIEDEHTLDFELEVPVETEEITPSHISSDSTSPISSSPIEDVNITLEELSSPSKVDTQQTAATQFFAAKQHKKNNQHRRLYALLLLLIGGGIAAYFGIEAWLAENVGSGLKFNKRPTALTPTPTEEQTHVDNTDISTLNTPLATENEATLPSSTEETNTLSKIGIENLASVPSPSSEQAVAAKNQKNMASNEAQDKKAIAKPLVKPTTQTKPPALPPKLDFAPITTTQIAPPRHPTKLRPHHKPLRHIERSNKVLKKAYHAFQRGDDVNAKKAYQQVLKSFPNNRDALLGLAALALKQNDKLQAQYYYQKVLHLYPQDKWAKMGLVNTQREADSEHNETQLKALLFDAPQSPDVHFNLGNVYARQQRWDAAYQAYSQAYRYATTQADYAYNLAISAEHVQHPAEALRYYQQAAQLAQQGQTHQFSLATVQQRIQTLQ